MPGQNSTLTTKVGLVTGSSRGIGAATAIRLAKEGCDVIVNYLLNWDAADKVVRKIEGLGQRAIMIKADVSDLGEVGQMIQAAVAEFGGLDILINNANYSHHYPSIEALSLRDWRRMIDVTLTGTFLCSQFAIPYLKQRKWGRIINIGSIEGTAGSRHAAHYVAAKAGIVGFTKSLALELGEYNITVNAVLPGYTKTDALEIDSSKIEEVRQRISLRRIAEPDEIASVIAFLASDEAKYITGEAINVNGGIRY